MGNHKIKQFLKQESKWTDKSAVKHKHDFSQKVTIQLYGDANRHVNLQFYTAKKCLYCNSFIDAKYTNIIEYYPILCFYKPHFVIGFNDIKYQNTIGGNN